MADKNIYTILSNKIPAHSPKLMDYLIIVPLISEDWVKIFQ